MAPIARETLGGYMSAECFRYLRQYAEETAGRGLIVHAGKQRGYSLKDDLNGVPPDNIPAIVERLNQALGKDGTRLCLVKEITPTAQGFRIEVLESACSYGMKTSTPNCAFTLGVFLGLAEIVTGKRYNGIETACVACGSEHCVYELEEL